MSASKKSNIVSRPSRFTLRKVITVSVVILLFIAGILALYNFPEFRGLREIKSYAHPIPGRGQCLALSPSCGVCPGEIVNDRCYVMVGTHTRFE